MPIHATVSATFPTLNGAETAIALLLDAGLQADEVALHKVPALSEYFVTIHADEHVRDVEEVLRHCAPAGWHTAEDDGQDTSRLEPAELSHAFVPEADHAEQLDRVYPEALEAEGPPS